MRKSPKEVCGYPVLPFLQGYKVMYPKTQKGLYGFLTLSLGNTLVVAGSSPLPVWYREGEPLGNTQNDCEPGQEGRAVTSCHCGLTPQLHSMTAFLHVEPRDSRRRDRAQSDPSSPPSFPRVADKGTGFTAADSKRL